MATNNKRNALGRGLGALISDVTEFNRPIQQETNAPTFLAAGSLGNILLTQIDSNPYQPRTHFEEDALNELAESIRAHGIIQPITVRHISNNRFQLISGERRLKASKIAGLSTIPAYILETDDQGMIEMALIENIQRENLNAMEIAFAYRRLMDECSLKQEQLGDRVGKDRTTINNYLRLLKLPPAIQIGIRDGAISMGHARALINIKNVDIQLDFYKQIIEKDLSVRKVEDLVRQLDERKVKKPESVVAMPIHIQTVQNNLTSRFETKVQIRVKGKGQGEIVIPYLFDEDLNRILEVINS